MGKWDVIHLDKWKWCICPSISVVELQKGDPPRRPQVRLWAWEGKSESQALYLPSCVLHVLVDNLSPQVLFLPSGPPPLRAPEILWLNSLCSARAVAEHGQLVPTPGAPTARHPLSMPASSCPPLDTQHLVRDFSYATRTSLKWSWIEFNFILF